MLFQIIFFLHPVGCGYRDDLADRSRGCARAIAVPVERLRLTRLRQWLGVSPVSFLNAAAKAIWEEQPSAAAIRHDRIVGVAQHGHGLLELVLTPPGAVSPFDLKRGIQAVRLKSAFGANSDIAVAPAKVRI